MRLFFAQDMHISGYDFSDSAYYESERGAVLHYKGKRWFMFQVARETNQGVHLGVDQWAVGLKETHDKEGAWRDAEDGVLSGNPVAQGSVDSAIALHLHVEAHGEAHGWYWMAVALTILRRSHASTAPFVSVAPTFFSSVPVTIGGSGSTKVAMIWTSPPIWNVSIAVVSWFCAPRSTITRAIRRQRL